MGSTDLSKLYFVCVTNPKLFIGVLQERHPMSILIQNQVLLYEKFKDELQFYTVGTKIDSNTWIVSCDTREDYHCTYSISAPNSVAQGHQEISREVRECFLNSGLINWGEFYPLLFPPMPIPVANMIFDISANLIGNLTEVHPSYLYYMEREIALKFDISPANCNIQLRRFDVTKHEEDFFLKTWKYALPGSETAFPKCLSKNASGGVFINEKCIWRRFY